MAPPGTYLLRADRKDLARWKAAAAAEGVSFADWVRGRLDASELTVPSGGDDRAPARSGRSARARIHPPAPRSTMCVHRISPGAFCKVCD